MQKFKALSQKLNKILRFENLQNLRFRPTGLTKFNVTHSIFKIQDSSFGHSFHGRPAVGHLSKPFLVFFPNSWKLVACQLQLVNKHSLTRQEFTCLVSRGQWSSCTPESIKYQFLKSPLLFLTPHKD